MLKNIFHLSFSNSIVLITNVLNISLLSRHLTISEYGTFRQTFLPIDFLVPIVGLGVSQAIYFLLPKSDSKDKTIVNALFLVLIPSFLVFIIMNLGLSKLLSYFFNNQILIITFFWAFFMLIFQTPMQSLISVLIYEGKTKYVSIISSSISFLFTGLTFLLIYFNGELLEFIILKSLYPFILFVFYVIIVLGIYKINFKLIFSLISRKQMVYILSISWPLAIASVLNIISMQVDKLIVSYTSSPDIFAIYANGAIEVPFIAVITGAISSVIVSKMSREVKDNNMDRAYLYFKSAATNSALILFPIMIFFLMYSREFMTILYSEKYIESYIPFSIYLFFLPIRIVVFGSAFIAVGKGGLIVSRALIELLLNIILSLTLYYFIGIWGIAISSVLVVYLWSVPYNIFKISELYGISISHMFEYNKLFKIMMCALILAPSLFIVKYLTSILILNFILSAIIYFGLVLLLYYFFRIVDIKDIKNWGI
tara:strand:- start:14036 stop:15481 length:1446 start_codon:yes stop_codon:yes gene_type:complete